VADDRSGECISEDPGGIRQESVLLDQRTDIQHIYSKTGDFWLPERNRSETKVRIGSTAILIIDYGAYHIEVANS